MSDKRKNLIKLIIYPLLVVFTFVSFSFVFFVILPTINNVALVAFGHDSNTLLSYGIMPFLCIDMCIVQGYLYLIKMMFKKTSVYFVNKEGKE